MSVLTDLVNEVKSLKAAKEEVTTPVVEAPKTIEVNVELTAEIKALADKLNSFESLKTELAALKSELDVTKAALANTVSKEELAAAKAVPGSKTLTEEAAKTAVVNGSTLSVNADSYVTKLLFD